MFKYNFSTKAENQSKHLFKYTICLSITNEAFELQGEIA